MSIVYVGGISRRHDVVMRFSKRFVLVIFLAVHFIIQVMNGASTNKRGRWLVSLLAMAVVASLLYRFFDRVAVFHDQLINTGRVGVEAICNYAVRPLFYSLLKLYVFIGGTDMRSIAFAGFLICGMIAWMQYRRSLTWFGWAGALSSVCVCVWMGWLYPIGTTGMPHIYPGLFGMIAFFVLHDAMARQSRKGIAMATFSVWLGLACHPTGIAYVGAFYLLLGSWILYLGLREKVPTRRMIGWALPAVVVGVLSLSILEGVYRIWGAKGYVAFWVGTLNKVQQNDDFSRYHAPVSFYVEALFARYWLLIALAVVLTVVSGLIRWVGKGRNEHGSVKFPGELVLSLFFYALAVVAVYSISSWRLERVLVGFCALFGYCCVVYIYSLLATWRRFGDYARVLVFILISVVSFRVFLKDSDTVAQGVSFPDKYTQPVALMKYGAPGDVLYVGPGNHFRRIAMVARAAGRNPMRATDFFWDKPDKDGFFERFREEGYGWLAYRAPKELDGSLLAFRRILTEKGFRLRFLQWGGGETQEFWEYLPLRVGGEIESSVFGHRGRIGVFEDAVDGKAALRALTQGQQKGIIVALRHKVKPESIRKRIESRRLTGFVVGGLSKDVEDRVENLLMDAGFELRATGPLIQGVDTEYRFWTKSVSE